MNKKIALLVFSIIISCHAYTQKKLGVYCVAFYNVENLFDTERDETIGDEEFTPAGANNWTPDKYAKKLKNIAYVLSQLGRENCPAGPAVIGLAEVENRRVLEDLVKQKEIQQTGYEIVHYDSPDRRGIDVALLYHPELFHVTSSRKYRYNHPENPEYVTRDQLLVSGILAGEPVHIIVNHWPSRYGGDKSSVLRETAAALTKHIADSLYQENHSSKIIIMGDLNDEPTDKSCRSVLNAKKKADEVEDGGLFNTMWGFMRKALEHCLIRINGVYSIRLLFPIVC